MRRAEPKTCLFCFLTKDSYVSQAPKSESLDMKTLLGLCLRKICFFFKPSSCVVISKVH